MLRKIVRIDEDKCNGCGDCIIDCPEGALRLVDGKARLVAENYCDGLGACLGACPMGAITIEEREAEAFDAEAVREHMASVSRAAGGSSPGGGGCPGSDVKEIKPAPSGCPGLRLRQMSVRTAPREDRTATPSQLSHWPIQLALVPSSAPFLQDADLLLVADCVPFALANFHSRFLSGHPIVVACPKLDNPDAYVQKLAAMLTESSLRSLTIIHMEVPCCTGLCQIVEAAMQLARETLPVREVTVSVDGQVIEEREWKLIGVDGRLRH